MDSNLIPTQERALEHASPAARQSHQDQLQANRERVEKGRVVPPYVPILTMEQRIQALEGHVAALRAAVFTPKPPPALPVPSPPLAKVAEVEDAKK